MSPPLSQVIRDALAASLKSDEPSWPTQRNWDACDGAAVSLHADKVASAVCKFYDMYTPEGSARFDR
ncbi:Uncharacterised protein [Mycobacteroides abscessus subsp. abscessus]|nr:Uncharacterised protein [Mycobacteroides abscessus subsp. abscessus]SIN15011.1 Uncharacterised protein [Mycobacteroides abscessus subsp. abscessus]